MPAPVTVTQQQVVEGMAELTAAGQRITGWSLRRVIGAGRPERLAAIAAELAAADATAASAPEPEAPALPPAVSDHLAAAEDRLLADLRGLVATGWRTASDLASRRVEAEVAAARARIAEVEDELAQAGTALDQADHRAVVQADEIEDLRRQLTAALAERDEANQRAEVANSATAEARRLLDGALAPFLAASQPGKAVS